MSFKALVDGKTFVDLLRGTFLGGCCSKASFSGDFLTKNAFCGFAMLWGFLNMRTQSDAGLGLAA